MKKILLLTLIISLLFSCNKAKMLNVKKIDLPENGEKVVSGGNNYGFEVFKTINDTQTDKNKNIMYSPLSLNTIFYMLYNGASGTTSDEIKETYKLQGINILNINQTNKTITKEFPKIDRNINFNIANSIWAELGLTLNSDFSSILKDNYEAEIENLSFSDPNSVEIINNWVKKKTEGKIPKLFETLKGNLIFVNALYFYGEWHSKFDKDLTQNRDFYLADSSKTSVATMEMKDFIDFATNEKYIIVELPYSQGNFVIDLILPQNGNTTDSIITLLANFDEMIADLTNAELTILLPKFEFKNNHELTEIIKDKMPISFSDNADFSGMSNTPEQIIEVLQKTYIKIDEEGTEAAAATAVVLNETCSFITTIAFNQPFIFVIREVSTNTILFVGKIANPKETE